MAKFGTVEEQRQTRRSRRPKRHNPNWPTPEYSGYVSNRVGAVPGDYMTPTGDRKWSNFAELRPNFVNGRIHEPDNLPPVIERIPGRIRLRLKSQNMPETGNLPKIELPRVKRRPRKLRNG
jgi:hypothetical protein